MRGRDKFTERVIELSHCSQLVFFRVEHEKKGILQGGHMVYQGREVGMRSVHLST